MIQDILKNEELMSFIKNDISENNVSVEIDKEFYENDDTLDVKKIVNIAVDNYYNSLGLTYTPPSIDNLVVINRGSDKYSVYLVELKDVAKLNRLCPKNIKEKFITVIDDFMAIKFKNEFVETECKVTDLNLWLVCNRFAFMRHSISEEDYEKRIKNSLIEKLLLIQPIVFRGKMAIIMPMFDKCKIE